MQWLLVLSLMSLFRNFHCLRQYIIFRDFLQDYLDIFAHLKITEELPSTAIPFFFKYFVDILPHELQYSFFWGITNFLCYSAIFADNFSSGFFESGFLQVNDFGLWVSCCQSFCSRNCLLFSTTTLERVKHFL